MVVAVALLSVLLVQDTVRATLPSDSYANAATAELVARARAARDRNERLVTSYRASVSQRIGVGVRAVGRDRMLFRQEVAANIEWYRDRPSRIEVVGARQGVPIALRGDQVPEDLRSGLRDLVINPAEDVLRFAGLGEDDEGFIYPLREGGERDYRFAVGDSTVIALPSGKRIRLLELRVIPRRSDWRLMSGALWFDGDTHGLVRMIFRPARPFEFRRDIPAEDREDVPRWVNPKGEVKYVTVEYGLYEERWWMLRYAAIDAVGTMGSWLNMPIRMEQVYADYEVEGGTPPDPASTFRPAGTRRQPDTTAAGVPVDSAMRRARADSVRRVVRECVDEARDDRSMRTEEGRRAYRQKVADCRHRYTADSVLVVAVPDDTLQLITSPALGEPILSMGDLISEDELRGLASSIGQLPGPVWASRLELPYGATEVLRHARFNRIEALSLGTAARADFGKFAVDGRARIGLADGWLNAEVGVSTGSTLGDNSRVAVYRRLVAANPETRPFGVMNSLAGLFTHRDDGQYYRTEGIEGTQTVGSGWLESRIYYERQRAARVETDFSIAHLLGSDAAYRPNIAANQADQFGGSLKVRGTRALSRSVGIGGEAFVEGATGDYKFGRGSVTLRSWVTPRGPLAFGASVSAGATEGTSPVQSWFYLGGPVTLRGYDGGVMAGPTFWTGRAEVANSFPAVRLSFFSDIGWAGARDEFWSGRPLLSAGIGASFLDGLIRADLARGLRSPTGWRFDLYLDGIL